MRSGGCGIEARIALLSGLMTAPLSSTPGFVPRCAGRVSLLAILALLTACTTGPSAPLMSPIASTGDYGYSEVPIGPNRYEVSYTGPSQRTLRSPNARRETGAEEHTQAYDFALWRAAQIALAQGMPGFRVGNVRTNVDTLVDDYFDPYYGRGLFTHRYLWGPGPYWGPDGAPSPYAYQQTSVNMDVTMLPSLTPGDYDARDTIDQLRKTYPGAEGTLPQPTPAPS
jgi:hypothetical protein